MIYALIYMMSAIISSLIMLISLCIKSHKVRPDEGISSDEVTFLFFALGAMLVPGLNLIVSTCYFYRVLNT